MAQAQSTGESVWLASSDTLEFPPLERDTSTEVCIVGAGIAGLTTAYLLRQAGKEVVVLDDGPIANGQTCMTTAHLSNAIDDHYFEIERLHGREGARLTAESHTAAIDRIERIAQDESIDCDFSRLDGYLLLGPDQPADLLDKELEAAHRTGVLRVERLDRPPIADWKGPCLRFPNQGRFHPLKYLTHLAHAILRDGGRIFCGTHATSIQGGERATIETADGATVSADAVVVATNVPINDLVVIHTKQAPYMSYVIGARVPRGAVNDALYWDMLDPYHYIRLQPIDGDRDAELLIVGGEDHKSGQADDGPERFTRLENWTRRRFPKAGEVEFRWCGQVMETVDGLAFIGRNPLDKDNVFVATGDSGMGMTHGTIAGILLTDLIVGRENAWAKLYDPSRKTLGAIGQFAKENLNVAAQFTDHLTGGDVESADEITPGQGAVIRQGATKIAVYRKPTGELVELSAICPHLGCVVSWNSVDGSWDCPCHGSRFTAEGKVKNGPANSDLSRRTD